MSTRPANDAARQRGKDAIAVTIDQVGKRFGKVEALRGLDATIRYGRLTGLVGPDGAGKTTLMRIMTGLLTPDAGRVTLAGFDVVKDNDAIHVASGYMPQRFGLYEDLSVMENMRLYARLRGMDADHHAELFDELLDFTRLGPFTTRLAGKLSGGMKQKLGLACALMARPEVLLLDEPGVGVDPVSRQDLWRMVQALTDEGMAVVWSTAYLDEAERCQSVLLLNQGRLLFDGPPHELTAQLEGRSFRLENVGAARRAVLTKALGLPSVSDGVIQGAGVRVVLRAGAETEQVQALADRTQVQLAAVPARFEDAFIDLLGGGPGGTSALAERLPPVELGTEVAVSCRHLTKRFGDFTATDSVSFEVRKGEIFGLLGPNGAGKSTTFKMLCGLLKPSAGEAHVVGHDLRRATGAAKSQLGYMAQKFSLYGLLSVRQNLQFWPASTAWKAASGASAQRDSPQRLHEMIDRGEGLAALALPVGYSRAVAAGGGRAPVRVDGRRSHSGEIPVAYPTAIAAEIGAGVVRKARAPAPVVVRHWLSPNLVATGSSCPGAPASWRCSAPCSSPRCRSPASAAWGPSSICSCRPARARRSS
ncbi:Multidrug ABC transporter ATP-binding protein OS=Rhodanobacter lindaniclasticus OX=75310 GN=B1991_05055 PE=4 SV=1 [Rhodanobacter lindaniclasticus]